MLKKVGVVIMALVLGIGLTGCGKKAQANIDIEIDMDNGGVIMAELYPNVAPITVANFVKLINENFFDGTIFHRVYPGFMIQGGGYLADGTLKQADSIKGEFSSNGVKNTLSHTRGVLSMARTSDPNSASSQFFIMVADNTGLDGDYAAFGEVTSGMDVVDAIVNTPNDQSEDGVAGKPLTDQVIKTIKIVSGEASPAPTE